MKTRESRERRRRSCGTIALLLSIAVVCQAEVITIGIKARVDGVSDPVGYLGGAIAQNDYLTGYYVFDSLRPDSDTSAAVGIYEYSTSAFGMWVSANGLTFGTNPSSVDFSISVVNGSHGAYIVDAGFGGTLLPLPDGTAVTQMFWQLNDYTGTALSSDTLPLTPAVPEHWNAGNCLYIEGGPRETKFIISGPVIETWVIPEPATIMLLACGILLTRRFAR